MTGGNDTKVTHGALAGAVAVVGWGVAGHFGMTASPEMVAASTVLITALFQWFKE